MMRRIYPEVAISQDGEEVRVDANDNTGANEQSGIEGGLGQAQRAALEESHDGGCGMSRRLREVKSSRDGALQKMCDGGNCGREGS